MSDLPAADPHYRHLVALTDPTRTSCEARIERDGDDPADLAPCPRCHRLV